MSDYSSKINIINNRYNPDKNRLVEERSYSTISAIDGNMRKYIRLAMNEVDDYYTNITLEAGKRVKEHLQNAQMGIDYRFQGSVKTQTHIRGASDIDLLTLTNKFVSTDISKMRGILRDHSVLYPEYKLQRLQHYSDNFSWYQGNSLQDLRELRISDEIIMQKYYSQCDITNSKAVKIHNTSLNRDVDIIPSVWYDNVCFVENGSD